VSRPNFFIVGAAKCGTTALCSYLREHPDVFMPERKELNQFGFDLYPGRPALAQYLQNFEGATTQRRVGESSVSYLYSESAANEIYEFDPTAQIIVMVRNPVDMMYALHSQLLFSGLEHYENFADALAAESRRWERRSSVYFRLFYRRQARLSCQVERYFKIFGRKAVHCVVFDDLREQPRQVYRDTLEFLDVDPEFATPLNPVNANKAVRSRMLFHLLRRPPAFVEQAARMLIPRTIGRRLRAAMKRWNTRVAPRSPLPGDLRQQLQVEFRPEVDRLSKLLQRDLTKWCDPEAAPP
jgi:hypothetical protein